MVKGRIRVLVQGVILGPSVGREHGYAGGVVQNPGGLEQILQGDPGIAGVEISGAAGVHQQKLLMRGHGLQILETEHLVGGLDLGRVVVLVAREPVGLYLLLVGEPVAVRVLGPDGGYGPFAAPGHEIVQPVAVEGLHDVAAAVVAVGGVAPLAGAH